MGKRSAYLDVTLLIAEILGVTLVGATSDKKQPTPNSAQQALTKKANVTKKMTSALRTQEVAPTPSPSIPASEP